MKRWLFITILITTFAWAHAPAQAQLISRLSPAFAQDPTKPPPPPPPTKPPPPPPPTEPPTAQPGGGGNQPQPQPSDTPVPPPLPTATAIATRRPAATRTPTLTATPSDTPTATPSPTPSATSTPSRTPRPDYLAPVTWTPSPTNPPTDTPTPAPTRTPLNLPPAPTSPVLASLVGAMARFPWLPAALGGLLLAGAAALRRLSPRWILGGLTVLVLAVVIFGLEWSPGQAMGPTNLQTLTSSGTWQISLAVLAAVVVTLVGGWVAGRVNAARPEPVEAGEEAEDDLPEETAAPALDMPPLFLAGGARLLITGPSRSGKSTILHNLIRYALCDPSFDEIVLLDGKGPELVAWSRVAPECTEYHGPEDIAAWIAPLERIAGGLAGRYEALVRAGARQAQVGSPRKLIIIDEIQKATRTEHGKKITGALLTINEQSGALGDVVVITTQRATHRALDKSISYNASQVIALKSPDYPGRFDVLRAIDQKKAVRRGLARPADDADVAAWVAEVAEVAEVRAERLARELMKAQER